MTSAPEDRTSTFISKFCAEGPQPNRMTGLLRLFLINHFADANNLSDPFKERLWNVDPAQSKILIEDVLVWTPTITEQRPGIIIVRNEWQSVRHGVFDSTTGTTDEGFRQYTTFWQGSHTLFAIAKEGPEVELLAAEIYGFLLNFGPAVRQYLDMGMFRLLQVGKVSRVQECKDHYGVPITVGYGWAESWTLRSAVPQLGSVNFDEVFNPGI